MKNKKITNVILVENASTHSGSMRRHITIVHEGQKNYKCEFCEKPFSTQGNLKIHIKRMHNGGYKDQHST